MTRVYLNINHETVVRDGFAAKAAVTGHSDLCSRPDNTVSEITARNLQSPVAKAPAWCCLTAYYLSWLFDPTTQQSEAKPAAPSASQLEQYRG